MVHKTVDHGKLWSICKLSHLKWLLGGTYMYGNYAIQGRKLRCCLGVNSKLIVFLVFFWNLLRLICNCLSCNYHWMIISFHFTSSPFQVPFLIMIVVNTLFFFSFSVFRSLSVHSRPTSEIYAPFSEAFLISKKRKQQRRWTWVSVYVVELNMYKRE